MGSNKPLILGAVGVAVVVLIAMLLLKVSSSPANKVDEAKIAQAEKAYQRAQAARARTQIEPVSDTAEPRPPRVRSGSRVTSKAPDDGADSQPARPRLTSTPGGSIPVKKLRPLTANAAAADSTGDDPVRTKMDGANRMYDRADYEGARDEALKILEESPDQRRMLRIVVSSSCIMGDHDTAEQYYARLPTDRDRRQMARRCSRYGVDLE